MSFFHRVSFVQKLSLITLFLFILSILNFVHTILLNIYTIFWRSYIAKADPRSRLLLFSGQTRDSRLLSIDYWIWIVTSNISTSTPSSSPWSGWSVLRSAAGPTRTGRRVQVTSALCRFLQLPSPQLRHATLRQGHEDGATSPEAVPRPLRPRTIQQST